MADKKNNTDFDFDEDDSVFIWSKHYNNGYNVMETKEETIERLKKENSKLREENESLKKAVTINEYERKLLDDFFYSNTVADMNEDGSCELNVIPYTGYILFNEDFIEFVKSKIKE